MQNCQNCGQVLDKNYCAHCGEKRFDPNDLNFKTILKNFFLHLIDFDFKIFRSFKVFITKPALLAQNYIDGVRVEYLKPLQILLIVSILYYFLFSMFPSVSFFTSTLEDHLLSDNFIKAYVDSNYPDRTSETYQVFAEAYNENVLNTGPYLILMTVPLLTFFISILFFFSKKPLIEHFILAIFLSSYMIFFITFFYLIVPLIFATVFPLFIEPLTGIKNPISYIWTVYNFFPLLVIFILYKNFSIFYSMKRWIIALLSIVCMVSIAFSIMIINKSISFVSLYVTIWFS